MPAGGLHESMVKGCFLLSFVQAFLFLRVIRNLSLNQLERFQAAGQLSCAVALVIDDGFHDADVQLSRFSRPLDQNGGAEEDFSDIQQLFLKARKGQIHSDSHLIQSSGPWPGRTWQPESLSRRRREARICSGLPPGRSVRP